MCLSEPQTAVARTLMSTSAWPGTGTGTCRTSVAEGPGAGFVLTTAVMEDGRWEPGGRRRVLAAWAPACFLPPAACFLAFTLLVATSLPPGRRARSRRG